jgi:hypothetical protein
MEGAPAVPREAEAWVQDVNAIAEHGLAPLALKAAAAAGVQLPESVEDRLQLRQRADTLVTLSVDAFGPGVVADLERAGMASVVTKGPGVAQAYPSRGDRSYVDLDVVVAPRDFVPALSLLRAAGFEQSVRMQARDYFDKHCFEAVNLVRPDGAAIDLHHHIAPWVWGRRLDFAELRRRSVRLSSRRSDVRLAHRTHNLLVCALHVVSDKKQPGQSLRVWRDVATLARQCDPGDVAAEAGRCRLDWWLGFILRELPPFARPTRLLDMLPGSQPTPLDRLRLRFLLPPALGARHHLGQAFRVPAPNAVAFLMGEVFPSRDSIHRKLGEGSGYRDWWRAIGARLRAAAPAPAGTEVPQASTVDVTPIADPEEP